jgi:hypothetical protein
LCLEADPRWLLEYDSATFAAYINTLQRQHFLAQKKTSGPGQYLHNWFNAPAAALLVQASQLRVSRPKVTIVGTTPSPIPDGQWRPPDSDTMTNGQESRDEFEEDMEAVRELEERRDLPMGGHPTTEEEGDMVMYELATQVETIPQNSAGRSAADDDEDDLREADASCPPVFRPIVLSVDADLESRVESRLRKEHEAVLEEQPKWTLLARVLKEIEDTIARVSDSHAGRCIKDTGPNSRSTRHQHGAGDVLVGPHLPPAPAVSHHDGAHGSAILRRRGEENDADSLPQQLATREERTAAGESGAVYERRAGGPGAHLERDGAAHRRG